MLDGSDLKSVRKNAGISQTDMAKKLDCDRRTIINYEQGVCEPKASQLFRWLSVCKIDLKPLASQLQHFKESIFVLFALPFISIEILPVETNLDLAAIITSTNKSTIPQNEATPNIKSILIFIKICLQMT